MDDAFLSKTYLLVVLIVFLAIAGIIFAVAYASYATTTPAAANQTQQQINTIRQSVTPESIFLNNFLVSIFAIVPIGGPILFGVVSFNTAEAIGQLAYSNHISPFLYVVGVYIPVGTIENLAYSVIVAESLLLTYALANGTVKERLKNQTWKSLLLYLALLAIAATVEAVLIKGI